MRDEREVDIQTPGGPSVYVSSGRTKVRKRSGGGPDVAAADRAGLFLRGPLQSGVLQQEMQTEFSLPVQNCW